MPLAIELAAARAKSMSLAEIAERLTDPLKMLTSSRRTAPERHRTLRATLDWSHALLTEPERTLLRRLSVFTDGCTLEAAAAVCGDVGVASDETLELLDRLVSQSLVTVDTRHEPRASRCCKPSANTRYERLEQAGEVCELRQRHRDWCLAMVASAPPEAFDTERVARLMPELENLRAAFRWTFHTGQVEAAGRLGLGLTTLWHLSGRFSEGRAALSGLLDLAPLSGVPPPEIPRRAHGRPPWPQTRATMSKRNTCCSERWMSRALQTTSLPRYSRRTSSGGSRSCGVTLRAHARPTSARTAGSPREPPIPCVSCRATSWLWRVSS